MKSKFLKLLALVLAMVLCFSFAGCGKKEKANTEKDATSQTINTKDTIKAIITVEGYGKITLALDSKAAPITVANFVKLADSGYYDGLTFHRVVPDFIIQGGDPEADGTGGSEETIKGEFSQNGVNNKLSHTRGAISMARLGNDPDSASSQFFIVQKDATYLDGAYAAFGYVTEGMEVVDEIIEKTPVADAATGFVEKTKQPCIRCIEIVK